MKFNVINPSDPYTMTSPDLEVAAVAVSLFGMGKYGLEGLGEDAGQSVPIFIFGGHDEWFLQQFGRAFNSSLTHVFNSRREELAAALESVTLTSEERSSMNDIGRRAKAIAVEVRQHPGDAA